MTKINTALYILLLVMGCIYDTKQRSTADSTSYIAAVVEFSPVRLTSGELTTTANANSYVEFITQASNQSADIVVFPEDGLTALGLPDRSYLEPWTTLIPDADDNYTPCTESSINVSEALKIVSCAARNNEIYVVINIAEKLPCEEEGCPSDNFLYYNTNVAFDRNGTVIAKYRKTNLFGEYAFNVTEKAEIITFDTDFGVTFGTFICFDILFREPAINLTRVVGVKDIIYTTAWFSETPFLTAVQTQYGWSFAEDVNLLASGYNNPIGGSAGSGIYLGRQGVGNAILPLAQQSTLLTYEVPKKRNTTISTKQDTIRASERSQSIETNLKMSETSRDSLEMSSTRNLGDLTLLYDNLDSFVKEALTESVTEKTLCHDNFCCKFSVSMNDSDPDVKYLLTVFHGIRVHLQTIQTPIAVCGVIQCANESSSSCGRVHSTDTTFSSISISGTFENFNDLLIMPVTLNTSVLPIENWSHEENTYDNRKNVTISFNATAENLVTFAFYVRDFGREEVEISENSADIGCLSPLLPLVVLLYFTIMG